MTDTDAESGFDGIGSMNQQPRSRCLSSSGRGFSLGYSGEGERVCFGTHKLTLLVWDEVMVVMGCEIIIRL